MAKSNFTELLHGMLCAYVMTTELLPKKGDKIGRYQQATCPTECSWSRHCYSTGIDYYQTWPTETAVKSISSLFLMLFAHWAATMMLPPPLHVDLLSFSRYWCQMPLLLLNCNDAVPVCHLLVSLCCFCPCCIFVVWLVWLFLLFCPCQLIVTILIPICCCWSCHCLDLLPLCQHQLIGVAILVATLDVAAYGTTSCLFCFCLQWLVVSISL